MAPSHTPILLYSHTPILPYTQALTKARIRAHVTVIKNSKRRMYRPQLLVHSTKQCTRAVHMSFEHSPWERNPWARDLSHWQAHTLPARPWIHRRLAPDFWAALQRESPSK